MRALKWLLIGVVGLFVLVAGGIGIFVATLDIDVHKDRIAQEVEKATGRKLAFGGKLKLSLFPRIELSVVEVRFANMAGGSRADMATVRRAELAVDTKALFKGELKVERVVLDGADILLETDKAGKGNWEFGAKPESAEKDKAASGDAPALRIDKVEIRDAAVAYRDGKTGQATQVKIARLELNAPDPAAPMRIALEAVYDKVKYALDGSVGPLAALVAGEAPYPVDLKIKAGDVRVALDGKIAKPLEGTGLDLRATVVADDVRAFGPLAGVDIPPLGALKLALKLADAEGGYKFSDIAATLGPQDLGGEVLVKPGKRLYVNAKLRSKSIDADRLLADLEAKPGAKPPAPPSVAKPKDGRIIPDTPVPLEALPDDLDIFLTYGIDALKAGGIAWKAFALDVTLANAKLTLRKADVGYLGGKIGLKGEVDGRAKPLPTLALRADVEKLDLGALLKELQITDLLEGALESQADLKASGKTVRQIAASLDGRFGAVIGEGKIVTKYLDFVAADLIGSLIGAAVGKEDSTKLNCIVVRQSFDKGAGKLDGLLLDTQKISIVGTGTQDLRTETLDLRFVPQPKDAALISLAVPIEIKGTMASPSIGTDKASVAKAAAGVALTTVFGPLALLMPLAKTGVEDKDRTPCARAIQESGVGQRRAAAPAPAAAPARRQTR